MAFQSIWNIRSCLYDFLPVQMFFNSVAVSHKSLKRGGVGIQNGKNVVVTSYTGKLHTTGRYAAMPQNTASIIVPAIQSHSSIVCGNSPEQWRAFEMKAIFGIYYVVICYLVLFMYQIYSGQIVLASN